MPDEEPQVESPPPVPAAEEPQVESPPPVPAAEEPPAPPREPDPPQPAKAGKPAEPTKPSEPEAKGSAVAFGMVGTFLVAAVVGLAALAVWRSVRKPRSTASRSPEPFDNSLGL